MINIILKKRFEKLISVFIIFLLIAPLSLLIFNKSVKNGSQFINNTSYNIRKTINKFIPEFDLLSTIPGVSTLYSSPTGKSPILSSSNIFKINGIPGHRYYLRLKVGLTSEDEIVNNKISLSEAKSLNKIRIKILSDFLPIVPTTLDTISIDKVIIPENSNKTLKLALPLGKGDVLTLFMGEQSYSENKPETLTPIANDKIKELAFSLSAESDLSTAINIRNFLFANYTYNIDTKESEKYIYEFLFNTKEGFCIHFTRAFILLATLNNISAREVSGYVTDIPNYPENVYESYNFIPGEVYVTGKDAHLWPEIYINGKWITFEVTPSVYREESLKKQNAFIEKRPNDKSQIDHTKVSSSNFAILITVIMSLIIIILSLLIFYMKKQYLKNLIKKTVKKGIPHPQKIGWVKWNDLVTNDKKFELTLLEINYKKRSLTKEEISQIKKITKLFR